MLQWKQEPHRGCSHSWSGRGGRGGAKRRKSLTLLLLLPSNPPQCLPLAEPAQEQRTKEPGNTVTHS